MSQKYEIDFCAEDQYEGEYRSMIDPQGSWLIWNSETQAYVARFETVDEAKSYITADVKEWY